MKNLSFDENRLKALFAAGNFPIYLYFDAQENKFRFDVTEYVSAVGVIWKNPFKMNVIPEDTAEQKVYEKVSKIFAEKLDISSELVVPSAMLKTDLDADSLDILELVMELERTFDIRIPDLQVEKLRSVGDYQKLCAELVSQNNKQKTHGA